MSKLELHIVILGNKSVFKSVTLLVASAALFCIAGILSANLASAQVATKETSPTSFRIGERLTYTVSFGRFTNVAYAEIHTVSRGQLGDKDAVELRSRIKTLDFASAAFYLIDQSRTTFAAAESGLPLFITRTENTGGLPKETIQNFLAAPTINFDFITLIHKLRHSGGTGVLTLQENDKTYNVTFQTVGSEKVKTDAGEFETSVLSVQSDYLTDIGLKELRINLSSDQSKIPVLFRFKTARKGEFRAALASISNLLPEPSTSATPAQTPQPIPTPKPVATPTPYIENQPLAPELSFALGESLEYKISSNGQPVGVFTLEARERRQFLSVDSLLLAATVTDVNPGTGLFGVSDSIRVQVNPETLGPQQFDVKFTGTLGSLTQSAKFDSRTSVISVKGQNPIEAPVGTHSILSLIYAIRSFNLKPSKDVTNPVNDTRVAVFWESQTYVFTLRPSVADLITLHGEKISAQLISIATGNPKLDQLNLKIWLGNDDRRLPLRFSVGSYQADLVLKDNAQSK